MKTFRVFEKSISANSLLFLIAVLVVSMPFQGCENQPMEIENYDPEPVLTAFLFRGEPFEEVLLERVGQFDELYDPTDYVIRGAEVLLFSMDGSDTLHLEEDPSCHGRYIPPADEVLIPEGKKQYRIEALIEPGWLLWAETVVPNDFALEIFPDPVQSDTLTREDPNFVIQWASSDSAGGYVMNVVCLADEDSLVPLDPDFDPSEEEADEDSLGQSSTWIMRQDQRVMTVPWIVFHWEGPYRIDVMAVASDYYDYVFSWFRVIQGAPVDLPSNVHGGLGIFAGLSKHSFEIYMKRFEE